MLQLANASRHFELDVIRSPAPHTAGRCVPPEPDARSSRPLRVGYVSPDLHEHAVGYLIADLFELHDREQNSKLVTRLEELYEQMWAEYTSGRIPEPDLTNLSIHNELGGELDGGHADDQAWSSATRTRLPIATASPGSRSIDGSGPDPQAKRDTSREGTPRRASAARGQDWVAPRWCGRLPPPALIPCNSAT